MDQSNTSMPFASAISSACRSYFVSNHPSVTTGQYCVTSNITDAATQFVKSCCPSQYIFQPPVNVSGFGGGPPHECGAGCHHPGEASVPSSELFCGHSLPTTACFNVTNYYEIVNGAGGTAVWSRGAMAAWALAVGAWLMGSYEVRLG